MGARGLTDQECIANAQRTREHDTLWEKSPLLITAVKQLHNMTIANRNSIDALTELVDILKNEVLEQKEIIKCLKQHS